MQLANRVQAVKPSATIAVSARANELKAQGKDIISLSLGEPDFDTPKHIQEAAIQAMRDGFTHYTAVDGIPSLKAAIIEKLQRDNQLRYEPNQIIASTGSKQSIYNLLQAVLNPGDEVIIPAPYWVSYYDMVVLSEASPVVIPASIENRYKITADQLEAAITDKTRIVFLNTPSNPTGVSYSHAELKALAKVLLNHPNIIIASDDIYEYLLWQDEPFANIASLEPGLVNQTVVLNGVSKAYAMTGWRIGYAAGPVEIIGAMKKIQSQSTSNPCSVAQKAAEAAISGDQSCVQDMLVSFKERHGRVFERCQALPGVKTIAADGTFYLFPDFSEVIAKFGFKDDIELAEQFLMKAGVAMVPGSAFGAPNCIRISFATSMEVLEQAMDRIENYLTA